MKYYEGKLEYDLSLDFFYISKGTIFGEIVALSRGDRLLIRKKKKWISAVLDRDKYGWYLKADGISDARHIENRCARTVCRRSKTRNT